DFVGQVGNLRPIGNRPLPPSRWTGGGNQPPRRLPTWLPTCPTLVFRPCQPAPPSGYNIGDVTKYIRYQSASGVSYGTLEGDTVHQMEGGLFDGHAATGATHKLRSEE